MHRSVIVKFSQFKIIILSASITIGMTACLAPDGLPGKTATSTKKNTSLTQTQTTGNSPEGVQSPSPTPSPSETVEIETGVIESARAVKIRLSAASDESGSFSSSCLSGNEAKCGAVRLFLPTDTTGDPKNILAENQSSAAWPRWIKSVEVGMTGTLGSLANQCARFTKTAEALNPNGYKCNLDRTSSANGRGKNCHVPIEGPFRVSEVNCGSIATGNGSESDPVYIRVTFDRNTRSLGPNENILAVLEYTATVPRTTPLDPANCFENGSLKLSRPECSDMTWQTFLKNNASATPQPFQFLVPPALQVSAQSSFGVGVATRQFLIPLSSMPETTIFQMSRIRARSTSDSSSTDISNPSGSLYGLCDPPTGNSTGLPAPVPNSPLCFGMVFYSLTLFRM